MDWLLGRFIVCLKCSYVSIPARARYSLSLDQFAISVQAWTVNAIVSYANQGDFCVEQFVNEIIKQLFYGNKR